MVRLWSPENPTREKTSSGLRPNAWRMKYSGIRRPEVEAREPKVNDLPAISFGNSFDGLRPGLGVGDEEGLEGDVLGALSDCLRAGNLPAAPARR